MRTSRVAPQIMVDFNTGNGYPSYNFSDNSVLADPSAWTVGELYDNADKSSGSAWTFRLDGKKDFDGGFLRQVKAGIRYDNPKAASQVCGQDALAPTVPFPPLPEGAQYLNHAFSNTPASVPPTRA